MSSIASLRVLLDDQKIVEAKLLKQLIGMKTEQVEVYEKLVEIENKLTHSVNREKDLKVKLNQYETECIPQLQQSLQWYQNYYVFQENQQQQLQKDTEVMKIVYESKLRKSDEDISSLQVLLKDQQSDLSTLQDSLVMQQSQSNSKDQIIINLNQKLQEQIEQQRDSMINLETEIEHENEMKATYEEKLQLYEVQIQMNDTIINNQKAALLEEKKKLESSQQNLLSHQADMKLQTQKIKSELIMSQTKYKELDELFKIQQHHLENSQMYLRQWNVAGQEYESKITDLTIQLQQECQQFITHKNESEVYISALQNDLSRVSSNHQQTTAEMSREIEKYESDLNGLNQQIFELMKSEVDSKQETESIEKEKQVLEFKYNKLIQLNESLKNDLETIFNSNSVEMLRMRENHEEEINILQSKYEVDINELKTAHAESIAELTEQVSQLEQLKQQVNDDTNNKDLMMMKLEHDYDGLAKDYSVLEKDYDIRKKESFLMEQQYNAQKRQISALELQCNNYKEEILALESKSHSVSALEDQCVIYQNDISELRQECNDYQNEKSVLQHQCNNYQNDMSILEQQCNGYQREITTLEQRCNNLKKEIQTLHLEKDIDILSLQLATAASNQHYPAETSLVPIVTPTSSSSSSKDKEPKIIALTKTLSIGQHNNNNHQHHNQSTSKVKESPRSTQQSQLHSVVDNNNHPINELSKSSFKSPRQQQQMRAHLVQSLTTTQQ